LRVDGRSIPAIEWRRRQAASLVKLLALAPRRTLHRERVIDALWPDTAIDDAGPRLHKAAHFARRALADSSSLVLSGDTVSLFPDAHVVVDVEEFERSAKQALAALDRDPEECRAAAAAADRWAGELLPDDPYEAWLEATRDRLRQLHQELLRRSGRGGSWSWPTRPTRKPASAVPGSSQTAPIEEPRCANWNGWSGHFAANWASAPALRWAHCAPTYSHPTRTSRSVAR
jgi:hypothetical protein